MTNAPKRGDEGRRTGLRSHRGFPARVASMRHHDNDVQIFVALQQKLH
jgi:hypothetical protein